MTDGNSNDAANESFGGHTGVPRTRSRLDVSDYDVEEHFQRMTRWLRMESIAEIERMAERRRQQKEGSAERSGETILNLVVADQHAGLGGMHLVTFKRHSPNFPMPWHRLRVGTPVVVTPMQASHPSQSLSGVVSERGNETLQVAMNRLPDQTRLRIDLAVDEVTRQRQMTAIGRAQSASGRLAHLRRVLMGQRQPQFHEPMSMDLPSHLNESQREAIRFALSADDIAVIHGPPGTGKTTTLVALIVQAVAMGHKVLACAPSNTAVDHLLEQLVEYGQNVVRIGHPARVSQRLQQYSLDGLVDQHESQGVAKALVRQSETLYRQAEKWTRSKKAHGERQEMRRAARDLEQEAKALERYMVRSILDRADIVCATTTFNDDYLSGRHFDWLVIDEACQSTEPGSWCPIPFAERIILAGDPQQLPPTVLSMEAAAEGFNRSLMQRQMELHGASISRLLQVQYRMHHQIMDFSSELFYDGQLVADRSVRDHTLADLVPIRVESDEASPFVFIDTAGGSWDEELEPNGLSKRNPQEAQLAIRHVQTLLELGVPPIDIGVIAPYAAQVRLLRDIACQFQPREAWRQVEIDTIDGFQGREKEAIIISLVRSNAENEIGFLADRRRMNVALTRARRKLVVIGDSSTLGIEPFYQSFLDYVTTRASYRTIWDEAWPADHR